jgi:hypothetical protein
LRGTVDAPQRNAPGTCLGWFGVLCVQAFRLFVFLFVFGSFFFGVFVWGGGAVWLLPLACRWRVSFACFGWLSCLFPLPSPLWFRVGRLPCPSSFVAPARPRLRCWLGSGRPSSRWFRPAAWSVPVGPSAGLRLRLSRGSARGLVRLFPLLASVGPGSRLGRWPWLVGVPRARGCGCPFPAPLVRWFVLARLAPGWVVVPVRGPPCRSPLGWGAPAWCFVPPAGRAGLASLPLVRAGGFAPPWPRPFRFSRSSRVSGAHARVPAKKKDAFLAR